MSKELEAFELLCRFLVEEINTLRHKDLNEDYFYNKKYGVTMTDKKTGIKYTTADIANALKELEVKREVIGDILSGNDEKKLKAFEFVKPYIDVYAPNRSVDRDEYMLCVGHDTYEISKEIYDLLKEVLL